MAKRKRWKIRKKAKYTKKEVEKKVKEIKGGKKKRP